MISTYHFSCSFFFFNHTATTEIYTLSLHDALPIFRSGGPEPRPARDPRRGPRRRRERSEEHTSELPSREKLVCRLLLEKKKNNAKNAKEMAKKDNVAQGELHALMS